MTGAPQGLPRLLPPPHVEGTVRLAAHHARYGPLPPLPAPDVIGLAEAAGLTGRGGAGFPTHRKLRAVAGFGAAGRRPLAVANGAEGEPASGKDALLLTTSPHLVIDGLQLAARAVGAPEAVLYVQAAAGPAVRAALAERGAASGRGRNRGSGQVPVTVVDAPPRFLSGEESALANRLDGGPAVPRSVPPRVFERGVAGRPTLVQNVETLAQLALIARFGAAWFRGAGTPAEPGTALFTVSGAVRRPGVVEAAFGTPLVDLLAAAGGGAEAVQAVLFGGYHGAWMPWSQASSVALTVDGLRSRGAVLGAGVVVVLPASACGVVETARVVHWLAGESAGQCGPCRFGLPALAQALWELASPGRTASARGQLDRWTAMVDGRGACHHPDGVARFLRSALRVFGPEVDRHALGRCAGTGWAPVLPLPPAPTVAAGER